MTTKEVLASRGLTRALIVDDGYDAMPRAEDIADDDDAWSVFVDDIGEDRDEIQRIFPPFEALDVDQLRHSDEFVAALWNARSKLREELWTTLFGTYEQTKRTDQTFLDNLETMLQSLGVECVRSGRTIPAAAQDVGLVFADLFLGSAQNSEDIKTSISVLRAFVRRREANPPIVVLMSRSELLDDRKAEFRDGVKLLGAMFRVHHKQDLIVGGTLARTLGRLAQHQPDAIKVAGFLSSWDSGLAAASERFLAGIRRLDLSDYAQIREVLLSFEGQPLGSYLLDVLDRVLQHEIEGDENTITAAELLNTIDPACYPPPYVAGSTDLQDLLYRTIWQNPHRLVVKTTVANIPVGFGDVLIRREPPAGDTATKVPTADNDATTEVLPAADRPEPATTAAKEDRPDALLVLTPACDLIRKTGAKRVLFVAGKLAELTHETWNYSEEEIKTPIVILPKDKRRWIRWNPKDLRSLLGSEIESLLEDEGGYQIAVRLRESHALELQQRILATMGRVGLLAQMPATFPVEVSAYFRGADGRDHQIALPIAAREGGVCYTGRDEDGNENSRLVLTEPVIDEILESVASIAEDLVHAKALSTLTRLKASATLQGELERGLAAPASNKRAYQPIKVPGASVEGRETTEIVGMISRNPASDKSPDIPHSCFLLVLRDVGAGL